MTAYVLLAIIEAGGTNVLGDGLPIARWLISQRNAYGGWSSTQVQRQFTDILFSQIVYYCFTNLILNKTNPVYMSK